MNSKNFVLTTLSQNPEFLEEVIHLIEEEFHYNDEYSYEKDFAPLVDPLNFENCYLYIEKESNTVAAHLAICIRTLVKAGAEVKVAFIGGIVTSREYRGLNLFKELMNYAIEINQSEVGLFVLWSDIEGLYEKFQFHRSGGLIETGKRNLDTTERPIGYEKTNFSHLNEKDFKVIIHLYHSFNEKYFFTVKREAKDWSIIREMDSIDLYVKRNPLNEIERYFCINKGRDLSNIIHEISCKNTDDYLKLIRELENFKLWLPETEKQKITNKEIFYTAFMRLGNITLLNKFLRRISKEELMILKADENFVNFQFQKKDYHATSKEFLQYIFGPKPMEEFSIYKLSLYIPGTDSI